MYKKKIIITGSCGYIGSHIAKAMQQHHGYYVVGIDTVRREHTLQYVDRFIQCDYSSSVMQSLLLHFNPDAIVHCAGSSLVGQSVLDPAEYYTNNVSKTIKMLDYIAKSANYKPVIIFSSSASVYGNPVLNPISETALISPISPYGHSKAMIEQILTDYDKAYNIRSVCLRYFNACGADPFYHSLGQAPGATHIIARLMEAKLNNTPFILNGTDFATPDGTCIRDYVHVWDLALAHIASAEYLFEGNKSVKLNLGTDVGVSNNKIIEQVINTVGHINIQSGERRPGDPDILVASSAMAKKLINWRPLWSTVNTIVNTAWDWYKPK